MPKLIVTDPTKQVTDPVLIKHLEGLGIDPAGVEFCQDYAMPATVAGKREKGKSPYAKFYKNLNGPESFMVVSGLPMVDADSNKVVAGWRVAGINYFAEKGNLFTAKVQGTAVELACKNDQPDGRKANDKLSYKPQLFLNGVEIKPKEM